MESWSSGRGCPAQRKGRTPHPAVLWAPPGLLEPRFPPMVHPERSLGQRQCPQLGASGVKNAESAGRRGQGASRTSLGLLSTI